MKRQYKKYIIIVGISIFILTFLFIVAILINSSFHLTKIELAADYNELLTKEELKAKGHINILPEYLSDVSIGFQNSDSTKTLYVYASPIWFRNDDMSMELIDTRLANTSENVNENSDYPYTIANSDIKPFFPAKLSDKKGIKILSDIEYEIGPYTDQAINAEVMTGNNFIGEQKMQVLYKNALGKGTQMCLYPSSLGANCEIAFNKTPNTAEFTFWMKIKDESVTINKEPGGYLILTQDHIDSKGNNISEILSVIQKPIIKTEKGDISYNCSIEFYKIQNQIYGIKIILDKKYLVEGSTAIVSFEMRREKQPDNALDSKLPNLENAYLSNYSVVGNEENYGIGRLMIRFVMVKNNKLKASQIKKASYYTYNLNNRKGEFEMLSVLEEWCSLTGNWNNNYKTGERAAYLMQESHVLKFDMTEEVKKWCNDSDGQLEFYGVQLKMVNEKEGEYNVLLSNDNSLYRNRTEILLQ